MNGAQYIEKIVHGLTAIEELSKANRHLSYSLKKEINRNKCLEDELKDIRKELKYNENIIDILQDKISILYKELKE